MARLLLVKDECRHSSVLQDGLCQAHHSVDIAPNDEDGLNLARRSTYHVLLLDIVLTGPDGREICRRLRSMGDSTPILLLTARDTPSDRLRGLDVGADEHLAKPFAFNDLLARIERLIRRRTVLSEGILQLGDLTRHLDVQRVGWAAQRIDLTAREHEIPETLMRRPASLVRRDAIIERSGASTFLTRQVLWKCMSDDSVGSSRMSAPPPLIQSQSVGYRLGPPVT